jgi:hypothetical protein
MATNWIVPTVDDLGTYLNTSVLAGGDEDLPSGDNRSDRLKTVCTDIIRAAIRVGGRTALSSTTGSIPPEAMDIWLALMVERLMVSTPRLSDFADSAMAKRLLDSAYKWLQNMRDGENDCTPPQDPFPDTPDQIDRPPVGVTWGDAYAEQTGVPGTAGKVDMGTDP